jgi:hypothetical protein
MKTKDFEAELKKLHPDLAIIPNPNRPGLSNVKLMGQDICPVPSDEIYEDTVDSYVYEFPNGFVCKHNSKNIVLARVNDVLKSINTKDGSDAFFGKGEYAE